MLSSLVVAAVALKSKLLEKQALEKELRFNASEICFFTFSTKALNDLFPKFNMLYNIINVHAYRNSLNEPFY